MGILMGCNDKGKNTPTAPANPPAIVSVTPDSAAVGDTVHIAGTNFGSAKGSSVLSIGASTVPDEDILVWSDTDIQAIIPSGATSAGIIVTVNGVSSSARPYPIKGSATTTVSFAADVHPILLANCAVSGCHVPPNPTGQFDQTTYAGIRAGGAAFGANVVTPGDSTSSSPDVHTGSGIMKMLRNVNNPYGNARMPLAGQYASTGLPDSMIVKIGTWIAQGALNN